MLRYNICEFKDIIKRFIAIKRPAMGFSCVPDVFNEVVAATSVIVVLIVVVVVMVAIIVVVVGVDVVVSNFETDKNHEIDENGFGN